MEEEEKYDLELLDKVIGKPIPDWQEQGEDKREALGDLARCEAAEEQASSQPGRSAAAIPGGPNCSRQS